MQHLQILVQIRLIAERVGGAPEVSERPSKCAAVFFTFTKVAPSGMVPPRDVSPDISMLRPTS